MFIACMGASRNLSVRDRPVFKANPMFLTARRKGDNTSSPSPLTCPDCLEGTPLSDPLAASRGHKLGRTRKHSGRSL